MRRKRGLSSHVAEESFTQQTRARQDPNKSDLTSKSKGMMLLLLFHGDRNNVRDKSQCNITFLWWDAPRQPDEGWGILATKFTSLRCHF